MPLIPLDIPAGIYATGTDLEASGRWHDGNLVRWRDGSLRPIGGWSRRKAEAFAAAPRGMHAWRTNAGVRWIAAGTWEKLYASTADNTISDITPAGFTTGNLSATQNLGFGGGFFGRGFFGTARSDTAYDEATTWSLDNWGENLVACSNADGKLYEWALNTSNAAAAISNAPTSCLGLVVSQERFLFALGAGGNPRKVQWSDKEDNTAWTPAATNEAGDIELQTPGQIMQAVRTRDSVFIVTDTDAHVAQYLGPPFVYGFERVGTSCGAISRKGMVSMDEGVFWMGRRGFYRYSGGGVEEVPCDVHDYVFDDINNTQASKIWAMTNGEYNEVWWFYCSSASNEIDRYVSVDVTEGYWSYGVLDRTAGVDRGVFNRPILADAISDTYDHETGYNYDDATVYAETGPISLGVGDQVMSVTSLYPDEEDQGDAQIRFKTRFHPNDTEREYGPYALGNPTSVRFTGRQIRMRAEGVSPTNWRMGVQRIEAKPRGRR